MTILRKNKEFSEKRIFLDTTIKDELEIIAEYEASGREVVGFDRIIENFVIFKLYLV